jgi:hypothetical protein
MKMRGFYYLIFSLSAITWYVLRIQASLGHFRNSAFSSELGSAASHTSLRVTLPGFFGLLGTLAALGLIAYDFRRWKKLQND